MSQSLSPLEAMEQDLHIPSFVSHQLRDTTGLEGNPTLAGTTNSAHLSKVTPTAEHSLPKIAPETGCWEGNPTEPGE